MSNQKKVPFLTPQEYQLSLEKYSFSPGEQAARLASYEIAWNDPLEQNSFRFDGLTTVTLVNGADLHAATCFIDAETLVDNDVYSIRLSNSIPEEMVSGDAAPDSFSGIGPGKLVDHYVRLYTERVAIVKIKADAVISDTILLDLVADRLAHYLVTQIVVHVGEGAVVECLMPAMRAGASQTIAIQKITIIVGVGAALTWLQYETELNQRNLLTSTVCFVHEKGLLNHRFVSADCNYRKSYLVFHMIGPHAAVSAQGAYAVTENDHFSTMITQHHAVRETKSAVCYKGVAHQSARVVYQGAIYIDKNCPHVSASQENKNIALDERATVCSVPTLEVLSNDVQCSHGSAVGRFDDDVMIYMRMRGLSVDVAQCLLLQSFFAEVVQDELQTDRCVKRLLR